MLCSGKLFAIRGPSRQGGGESYSHSQFEAARHLSRTFSLFRHVMVFELDASDNELLKDIAGAKSVRLEYAYNVDRSDIQKLHSFRQNEDAHTLNRTFSDMAIVPELGAVRTDDGFWVLGERTKPEESSELLI